MHSLRVQSLGLRAERLEYNIGALILRIGFGGILYYTYNKEPRNPIQGPHSNLNPKPVNVVGEHT